MIQARSLIRSCKKNISLFETGEVRKLWGIIVSGIDLSGRKSKTVNSFL